MYAFVEFTCDHQIVAVDLYTPQDLEQGTLEADLDAWKIQGAGHTGYAVHPFEPQEAQ